MRRLFLVLLLLLVPTALSAQTYSACPAPASAQLNATYGGITVPVPITISEYAYGGVPATFTESFNYTTVTQLRADPKNSGFYGSSNSLSLATKCKAVRLNFNPAEHVGGKCEKYYVGYDMALPVPNREIFIEMWVRFDPQFELNRPKSDTLELEPGCSSTSGWWPRGGFVMAMGRVDNAAGAFGVTLGEGWPVVDRFNLGAACYYPASVTFGPTYTKQMDEDNRHTCGYGIIPSLHAWKSGDQSLHTTAIRLDGQWHRYRFWFRTGNARRNQGGIGVWVDDQHMATLPVQDAISNTLTGLALGRFMWHKPPRVQYVEYGRIRIWNTNPGWSMCEYACGAVSGIDIP